jgi:hypothetical protein
MGAFVSVRSLSHRALPFQNRKPELIIHVTGPELRGFPLRTT